MAFKLTYSTMFDPPEELHTRFDKSLAATAAKIGAYHPLFIDGRDVDGAGSVDNVSPIDGSVLGRFATANSAQVNDAFVAAQRAYPSWRATDRGERIRLSRQVATIIEDRVYDIAATLCLEVGKNRLEALAESQEAADFFRGYANDLERARGFDTVLPNDPIPGVVSRNRSVLKPYGVWGVVAPFNFPLALAAGPAAAALVTGNTVVLKGATDTPWSVRLLADCIRDAGYPRGVFNLVAGEGSEAGEALVSHPHLAGITFTGSYKVGMNIQRRMQAGAYPRPCIAEMGGKNACIVTEAANLDHAVSGIVRSAFGMGGQKCSALSRVYVAEPVADLLLSKLLVAMRSLSIGDPTRRETWLGPVVSENAVSKYLSFADELGRHGGRILMGGTRLTVNGMSMGNFVAPTLATAPPEHPLYSIEMFLPIAMVARVAGLHAAVAHANASDLGLTAGFYGSTAEAGYFLDNIEAGTTYVNRPQGATTGAWPWFQAFTGWKGSTSTGKAIGSSYYLPQYLREQSQTVVQ
jgi:acyl-CoA reductase-like NAD-dependent aldehyde dehydrogenase